MTYIIETSWFLAELRALTNDVAEHADTDADVALRDRLERSAIRPLAAADVSGAEAPAAAADGAERADRSHKDRLLDLAERATRLRLHPDAGPGVLEATAALQDLAAAVEPDILEKLRRLQGGLPASITVATNGPYLATNVPRLVDWLGVPLPSRPQLALCRCGQSSLKPLCDGTHRDVGFTDVKDPHRVPDQRTSYSRSRPTQRGCAHAKG